ncbi:MAG: hypothetical protein OXF21_06255 [bacterium]|nr:hypothetical protein [bacterium]
MAAMNYDNASNHNKVLAARRKRIVWLTKAGQRLGYLLYLAAMAMFFIGFASRFSNPLVSAITVCLVVGSLVLAPAIVFSYAVRAANREDPL